jgi:N-acetylglucosaminyldiphosphoundecaprenol N-acetyl-beta-D-mannosaminyltransferase
MEVWDDREYEGILIAADLVVPDGRPIYWAQKLLGAKAAEHVRGMDLMPALCAYANTHRIPIGFYGGAQETLDSLQAVIERAYPNIPDPLFISPPFRELAAEEKKADIDAINNSGVQILFVGLGCPKQERWMAENQPYLSCVLLGVGANFDFIAGTQKHAPRIFRVLGLEWLFRLCCEPRRLWRRYLSTNPRFIWYFAGQMMGRNYK